MKKITILLLIIASFCLSPSFAFAYDEVYTHPYLTKLIITQWEKTSGFVLTDDEKSQIIAGSQAEDDPNARSLNHFYNPLNKQGLSINDMLVGNATPDWLTSKTKQSEPLFYGTFTWGEGVEAYKTSDRARALAILGHSLHLLEDMAMPAHTRNDEHVEGDAYESWIKTQNSLSGQELSWDPRFFHEVTCATAPDCLRAMATFTNANFFSADTIYDKNFPAPKNSTMLYYDGYARAHGRVVAYYNKTTDTLVLNSQVLRENWRALTPELISYGVKMMNLFLTAPSASLRTSDTLYLNSSTSKLTPQISAGGVKIKASDDTLYLNSSTSKLTPQISAGGVKIKASDNTLYLNSPTSTDSAPTTRWWPVIDFSKTIPPQFLGSTSQTFTPPQVAGNKIISVLSGAEGSVAESTPTPSINLPVITPTTPTTTLATTTTPTPPTDPPLVPTDTPVVITDTEGPQANFVDLASSYPDPSWTLHWLAHDNVSATSSLRFDVDFKLSSDWTSLVASTTASSTIFSAPLADGAKVTFRLRATDVAGNTSVWQEATVTYIEPNKHNPLLYEQLKHLYNFSECSGNIAHDTLSDSNMTLISPWIDGRWGCGIEQDWPIIYYMNATFTPFVAPDLTLAFFMKDVSDFNRASSRNILSLIDAHSGIALQITPSVYNIRYVSNNGWEQTLKSTTPFDHNWHSIFVVVNKNFLALYIDGALAEQIDGDFSPTSAIKQLSLAGENAPTQFDEIAIWSRSLSSEEIMAYYNIAKPLKP